ncbi:DUF445 domain-containing protein [Glutamicibacter sp. MNS18]|uniref:DUF445 domain-containing protein n=1 Tax=Glutamicibacter sp. MNS18 TaxID=2989817 RepID=UPI0022360CE4|nr:DUF445 domain-containing protein [Glutamicibacter sp. MNS18]MCW4466046.1 DUF445 domain-containing protein [Glutamicibacter sp. MNS18]
MPQLLDPRAQALRNMKRLATTLFAVMCLLFVISLLLMQSWPAFGYLKAAAEGGMVGAVADWFAVTAIFRHPLGLRIPHTNLIQRKKDELGESLGGFVQENFLSAPVVARKLRAAGLPERAGRYLSSPDGAGKASTQAAVTARGALDMLDDEQVLTVLQALAHDYMVAPEWSTTLGALGGKMLADGHHEQALTLLAERAGAWVRQHPEVFREVIASQSPGWVPRVVDELLAQKIHRELTALLKTVTRNAEHPLRRAVTRWLVDFTDAMQHDADTIAKVELFKHSLLTDQQLRELAIRGWGSLKAGLHQSLANPESALRVALLGAVTAFGHRLLDDQPLRQSLEDRLIAMVERLVRGHGSTLAGLVSDTVQAWDPAEASAKLELQVGRDLQFIRINGTVIGALAGLVIFSIGQLILALWG